MPVRVSVIIPTYNWSTVLPFSIASVLDQTFGDFELLVVGDGCSDDSAEVVARIDDPRVRWINLPANSGHQSGPNNEGLRQARGELIAYLGHDDLWMPHHLTSAVAEFDRGADVVTTIVAIIGASGDASPRFYAPPDWGEMPPTGISHRKRVTDAAGGWTHYRNLTADPEVDLLRRARSGGFRFSAVPRLTAVKFPAARRRDVYRTRPSHEQAAWLERIRSESDLEARLMGSWLLDPQWSYDISYGALVRRIWTETIRRFRRRMKRKGRPKQPGAAIDARRRFKGL